MNKHMPLGEGRYKIEKSRSFLCFEIYGEPRDCSMIRDQRRCLSRLHEDTYPSGRHKHVLPLGGGGTVWCPGGFWEPHPSPRPVSSCVLFPNCPAVLCVLWAKYDCIVWKIVSKKKKIWKNGSLRQYGWQSLQHVLSGPLHSSVGTGLHD